MADLSSLLKKSGLKKILTPKDIFETNVRTDKFAYLRGDQQKILTEWYSKRNNKDTTINMNTGAGKTVVGLLQLQSLINEGMGPGLYLCLNNQLVDQVIADAKDLGISAVKFDPSDNSIPIEFLNSKSILVTNLNKLFNSKSVFGLQGGGRQPVKIGSIVIDDAHAAAAKAREAFTLHFDSNHLIYKSLVPLFTETLLYQARGTAMDIIERKDRFSVMLVPYWSWMERLDEVIRILSVDAEQDLELKFKWPTVRDYLMHYYMIIAADRIEIIPKCLPIQKISSFYNARRRIHMSATLIDDSILIRDFQISKDAVIQPLVADTLTDIGEKMILAPYNMDRTLNQEQIATLLASAKNNNIVVLVGSDRKAQFWMGKGFIKPTSDSIKQVLDTLKLKKGNHVVLSNRYDGVDLPGDMCRILVIDDLPGVNTLFEQYSMYARPGSKILRISQAQKIEQGLGRAVRSVNDYCVILICGKDLVSLISTYEFQLLMSPQAVEQIKLGNDVIDLMRNEDKQAIQVLFDTMQFVLKRDETWIRLHKERVLATKSEANTNYLIEYAEAERKAFDYACSGRELQAGEIILQAINEIKQLENADKGWYLQLAAAYIYHANREKAMDIQLSAHSYNTYLLKPPQGVRYQKLTRKETQQSTKVVEFIGQYTEWNGLIMYVNNILDKLIFAPKSSRSFEKSMMQIGICLGFETQQPEKEFGVGSDVLWNLYGEHYLVIEAKNEVLLTRDVIYKDEAEQIGNSMNWFAEEYVGNYATPVLVHPVLKTSHDAYPPAGTLILQPAGLSQFNTNVREFFYCLAQGAIGEWSVANVAIKLKQYKLDRDSILSYMKAFE